MMTMTLLTTPVGHAIQPTVTAEEITDDTITLQIDTVEIDIDQLKRDNYLVTVPVSRLGNTSFETFQCGAAWDTSQLTVLGTRSTADGLMANLMFTKEKDFIWMQFMGREYTGSDLCSITFQVNENVQPGDFLVVQGEIYDVDGYPAQYVGTDANLHPVAANSGGIRIVENVIPDVTVEIGDVTVEVGALEDNDYIVEVPVKATVNNGFFGMRFGLSWDASKMTALPPSSFVPEGLSITPSMSSGTGWVRIFADETYKKSELLTLQFILPETVRPGDQFTITAEMTGAAGTPAMVINSDGTEGTLNLKSGSIRVKSNQPVSVYANANIAFPQIEVTLEELKKNNYQVSYPIPIAKNSALTELSFGASWNPNELIVTDSVSDDAENLALDTSYSPDQDALWFAFSHQGKGAAYLGTALCTMTLQINANAAEGDVYQITAENQSFYGADGEVLNVSGEAGVLILKSGCVKIVTEEEKSAQIGLELGDIAVNTEELYLSDNQVSVPILIHQNTLGLISVSFGVSWDAAQATPLEVKPANNEVLGVKTYFEDSQDGGWVTFISIDPYNDYTFTDSEMCIGYLVLQLTDAVQVGDTIPVYMDTASSSGESASGVSANGLLATPKLINGSVHILDASSSETTTDTTEWTKPTRTSTTTALTTASASSAESTTAADSNTTTETIITEQTTTTAAETTTAVKTTTGATASSTSTASSHETTASETTAEKTTSLTSSALAAEAHLSHELLTLTAGQTGTLTFYPDENSAAIFNWVSRDPHIVRVNTVGNVLTVQIEALKTGVTTVSVMCGDEIYRCEITVVAAGTLHGFGDVDMDGKIDTADAVLMSKCIAGVCTGWTNESIKNADLNGDGIVDCKDILLLWQNLTNTASQ